MRPKDYAPFTPGEGVVEDYDIRGRGVVKDLGFPVFVPGGVPGDRIRYRLLRRRRKVWEGELMEVTEESPERRESPCPYFPRCGGCDMMDFSYQGQLKIKKNKVEEDLRRIGKIDDVVIGDTVPSQKIYRYRNHMQFKVKDGVLGLYEGGTSQIVPIRDCLIAGKGINRVLRRISGHKGLRELSRISLRENSQGEVMVILSLKKGRKLKKGLLATLLEEPTVSIYQGEEARGKGHFKKEFSLIAGRESLREEILGNVYEITPGSFFQVNTRQGEKLIKKGLELLDPKPTKKYLDLYCGVGAITLPLSKSAASVTGVEYVGEAVEAARRNGEVNGRDNVRFAHGKAENVLEKILEEDDYDGCILDPPRNGCDREVLRVLAENPPEEIVYISCNPSTWARDVKILTEGGYKLLSATPVDMFCHSLHTEVVSKLIRR